MNGDESASANLRQLVEDQLFVPNEASLALAHAVLATRPWSDEFEVAAALRSWADRFCGTGSLEPGLADGAGQVAEHIRRLGGLVDPPSDGDMIGITFHMLRNVAAGRDPTQYDLLRGHLSGVPDRTIRRYRQRAREAGGNPEVDALGDYLQSLQYDLDVAALVRGGRSQAAARRWLQRHLGMRAKDAPPARRRG